MWYLWAIKKHLSACSSGSHHYPQQPGFKLRPCSACHPISVSCLSWLSLLCLYNETEMPPQAKQNKTKQNLIVPVLPSVYCNSDPHSSFKLVERGKKRERESNAEGMLEMLGNYSGRCNWRATEKKLICANAITNFWLGNCKLVHIMNAFKVMCISQQSKVSMHRNIFLW